ncbi:adenylate/guanylate cyclase domain-containing protein [bacterium]|nr:adenylate/guanylate cyclase domain-containing protein [bacterium]
MLIIERLDDRLDNVKALGLDPDWVDWLGGWLKEATPEMLARINPRTIAAKTEADLHYLLHLLIGAVKAGVLDLHWEHYCPHCKGQAHHEDSLKNIKADNYCPACKVDFENVIDHNVVISFSLNLALCDAPLPEPPMMMLDNEQVRAVELFTLQAFRELFPNDVLPADQSLQVRDISLMFTDLRGSTALYERLGDSKAYHLVRDHFRVLFEVVGNNRGAVVKTIGDAVMAVFSDPLDALRCAVTAQGKIARFNQRDEQHEDDLIVRIGLDRGPAISVNLNERLDFFGTTVNRAARVEGLSGGNDIVLGGSIYFDSQVRKAVEGLENQLRVEQFNAKLKGYDKPVTAVRLSAPRG